MKKEKTYRSVRLGAEVVSALIWRMRTINPEEAKAPMKAISLSINHDDATWDHDSVDEFIADYRKHGGTGTVQMNSGMFRMVLWTNQSSARLIVEAATRAQIESVFEVVEAAVPTCSVPEPQTPKVIPTVFIGHGSSPLWRELKDHLHEKHSYPVVAYETGARAGHTIRDILEEMINASSFALLVMTAEDEQADGSFRCRQNVVHEAGLFQGRLGFGRAVMLVEDGVEEFSNVQGVQYLHFAKGNIKEVFGDVLATLRREFTECD